MLISGPRSRRETGNAKSAESAAMRKLIPLLIVLALPLIGSAFTGWQVNPRNPNQVDRYENWKQVGAYFKDEGRYYRLEGGRWMAAASDDKPVANFGLDTERLESCPKRIAEGHFLTHAGRTREISIAEACDLIEKGLPDDRHKPWIVAPGLPPDKEKQIRDDFDRSALASTHRLWTGPANHFHMLDTETKQPLGYAPGQVWMVAADGELLARASTYNGPEDFAALQAEAIRRPKPLDPDKTPDIRKPKQPDGPRIDPLNPKTWTSGDIACGGLCGLVLLRLLVAAAKKSKEGQA